MSRLRRRLRRAPVLGPLLLLLYRIGIAGRFLARSIRAMASWLVHSRETTNLTYDLTPLNREYLVGFVADVTGQPRERILGYVEELEGDAALARHVAEATRASRDRAIADPDARFARRLGWYALVRATRPRVVVETGVDKGLGACVLTAALIRNGQEGHPGRYLGTDIDPAAGALLRPPYAAHGEILYGDSLESLAKLDVEVDLFINDSDHSLAYEAAEYEAVAPRLSHRAFVVSDNAHLTDALLRFALRTGRRFAFFKEEPADHWFEGGGIGVAWGGPPAG